MGGLIGNPLVSVGTAAPTRLDDVLQGRTAVLTARRPDPGLVEACRRDGLLLVRVGSGPGRPEQALKNGAAGSDEWVQARLTTPRRSGLESLLDNESLAVLVRPDRVVAALEPSGRSPRVPWSLSTVPVPAAG